MKKILLISLSNIGDAIMTTPTLEALHAAHPEAEIDIVAGQRSMPVFQHCPYRGEIYIKDKKKWLRGYPALLRQLRKQDYDLVVDLRTDGFSWFLKAKQRCQKPRRRSENVHAVNEHLAVIAGTVQIPDAPETALWLSGEEKKFAASIIDDTEKQTCLAIGPGCGGPEKVWPPEKFAELANRLGDRFSLIVLLGGPGDKIYADKLEASLNTRAVNLTGKTDILQAAAVIQRCHLFIGNDSGLGHLASAVTTPSLTLFGVGYPERYHPWQEKAEWLCDDQKEVSNISVDSVLSRITSRLL